ncbi:MAG: response regulator, partial [Nitrospira sp.]|nr:response regulator [Nitrospira sp.]
MNIHQPTLLLVDDDLVNLEILVEHLEEAGYQTVSAMNGCEAWSLLEREPERFDAVLLDRMMPVMNGMEVLAKIKAHGELDFLPVILQTAAGSTEEVRQGIEAGAFYYLTKPFTKDVVLAIVRA